MRASLRSAEQPRLPFPDGSWRCSEILGFGGAA
jgi:hypothetical protein